MAYTYGSIKTKIRHITGRIDTDQLSEAELATYIENFYTVTLPNSLKTDEMLQPYSFQTEAGVDEYDFPITFYTLKPDARCDGGRLFWYEDRNLFFNDYPEQIYEEELAGGDGVTVTFTGTLENIPLLIDSLMVYDGVEVLLDNGDGTLTGDLGGLGTIDYVTGDYAVTFTTPPAATTVVTAKYEPLTWQTPKALLLYNKKIIVRPVPDSVFNISMQGYFKPTAMTDDADTPFSDTIAPLIIYGTSLEIFAESGDLTHHSQYYPIYLKNLDVAMDKTVENLSTTRSIPKW
jgi:hypothetical protein